MATRIFLGTSATDPSDWNQTDNWSGATVPVATDDVYFNSLSAPVDVTTNINQSGIALTSLTIDAGFEGTIGTADTFLEIGATDFIIGAGDGNGSQRINIDAGSTTAATINVIRVPTTGADTNYAPLRLKANNASTDIQINGETSNVSILDEDDATGTISDIDIVNSASVLIGRGCTYSTLTQLAGTSQALEATGTMRCQSGTMTLDGTTAITSVIQTDGTVIWNSTGTCTAYTGRGGLLDTTQTALARTLTTLTKSPGFTILRHTNVTIPNDNLDTDFETYEISVSEAT
jgi:hypothetical protein